LVGLLVVALLTIAPARAAEVLTYIHNDVAGNPVAATDQNGVVRWRESYRPYGERTVNAPAAAGNRQFFHGKAVDPDTGLSYFGARYYDPVVGRFMGVDPQHFDENKLHSFNRYAYANNNPYRYVDPDGRSPLDIGFLLYDLGSLAHALYQGNSVGEAAIGVGLSVVGVISPVPGTGAALKAARAAEHAVGAGRVANEVGHVAQEAGFAAKGGTKLLTGPAARAKEALQTPERIIVDSRGNAIPLNKGEYLTGSKDGRFVQVRDANGNVTGMRIDGAHSPKTHNDPRALQPHAHVPGVTNADGTPWLPIK